jgi:hypothetical protein
MQIHFEAPEVVGSNNQFSHHMLNSTDGIRITNLRENPKTDEITIIIESLSSTRCYYAR